VPELPEEVREQGENVLGTLPQRGQLDDRGGNAMVEVPPERAAGLLLGKVTVGGADQAEPCALPDVAPDPLVGSLLHDPQQLGLEGLRQLPHLV
jgi:hypothetical protein